MSRTIYVVYGETGEYSDHSEWNIAAYATEADAQKHADAATKWYRDNDCAGDEYRFNYTGKVPKNPYDPAMLVDYTGTRWAVYPVELFDGFKERV